VSWVRSAQPVEGQENEFAGPLLGSMCAVGARGERSVAGGLCSFWRPLCGRLDDLLLRDCPPDGSTLPPPPPAFPQVVSAGIRVEQQADFRDVRKPGARYTTATARVKVVNESEFTIPAGTTFLLFVVFRDGETGAKDDVLHASQVTITRTLAKRNSCCESRVAFNGLKSEEILTLKSEKLQDIQVNSGEKTGFLVHWVPKS